MLRSPWPIVLCALPAAAVLATCWPAVAAPQATSRPSAPELKRFSSARAALLSVLRDKPAVLGIGEYHQKKSGPQQASSLRRFTRQLLPLLRRRASDLVIETWITAGNCGSEEKQVVDDVDKTTERPAQTENEILTLVKRARSYQIRPHVLEMSCADYKRLLGGKGVSYEVLLKMTADRLREKVLKIAKVRLDPVKRAVDDSMRGLWAKGERVRGGGERDLVVVYGGALHNDLQPRKELSDFSYARQVQAGVGGRYLEVDLFVPEYIEGDSSLLKDQSWFPLFQREQSHKRALLIRTGERSYVIVFRRSTPRKP